MKQYEVLLQELEQALYDAKDNISTIIAEDTNPYNRVHATGVAQTQLYIVSDKARKLANIVFLGRNGLNQEAENEEAGRATNTIEIATPVHLDLLPASVNQAVAPTGTRSDYARWLHQQEPTLSVKDIARKVGLAESSVRRAIKVSEER